MISRRMFAMFALAVCTLVPQIKADEEELAYLLKDECYVLQMQRYTLRNSSNIGSEGYGPKSIATVTQFNAMYYARVDAYNRLLQTMTPGEATAELAAADEISGQGNTAYIAAVEREGWHSDYNSSGESAASAAYEHFQDSEWEDAVEDYTTAIEFISQSIGFLEEAITLLEEAEYKFNYAKIMYDAIGW